LTAAFLAPVAKFLLDLAWTEAFLLGAVVASTDAAAVFLLLHARGLRLRPRVGATLEIESGTNDPLAIFLTILLVEILLGGEKPWPDILASLAQQGLIGAAAGIVGGRGVVWALNRLNLPQGLHAPFVATAALVIFGLSQALHGSGFLAVYLAGLIVGNRPTRAHSTVIAFVGAMTWLVQIVMFVMLGLLVWPGRLPSTAVPAVIIAVALMLVARPAAVFLCLAPFSYSWREKLFIAWVGLRGAVGIFLASIPLLVGLSKAYIYFDVAFVVVLLSLIVQGWTLTAAARLLNVALPRADVVARRVELDLPGQLEQELVGYEVGHDNPYLRRRIAPSWAKLTLVVRDQQILSPQEAGTVREGDHVYFLAPPEKAQSLDRFFVDLPPPARTDLRLLGDFFVPGEATVGALAEIYALPVPSDEAPMTLSDYFSDQLGRPAEPGDALKLGPLSIVAHTVADDRVTMVGLRLADGGEAEPAGPVSLAQRWKLAARKIFAKLRR
jgi:cell volume regulation protein A